MANYSASADHYAFGGDDGSGFFNWYGPEQSDFDLYDGYGNPQAWAWFEGATAVLAATSITSATLTISGLGSPATSPDSATVRGGESEDEHLPLDFDEAVGRTLTTASTSASLDGQTSVNIDITAIINELRSAINGDVIQLRINHPTSVETGMTGLTASLSIEYTPGDVAEPVTIYPTAATASGHAAAANPMALPTAAPASGHASAVSGLFQIADGITASGHASLLVQAISPLKLTASGHAAPASPSLLPLVPPAIGHGAPVTNFLPAALVASGHAAGLQRSFLPVPLRATGLARRIRSADTFPKVTMTAVSTQSANITAQRQ